jgi:hypothetical protein
MWGCGPSAQLSVPKVDESEKVLLDLSISCDGSTDVSCPQWDHIVQLRACYVPDQHTADAHHAAAEHAAGSAPVCDALSGPEIGRWMTSFGRRVGHWLTDITPVAPLLSGQRCNLTIFTAPWEGNQGQIPWLATLALVVTPKASNTAQLASAPATTPPAAAAPTAAPAVSASAGTALPAAPSAAAAAATIGHAATTPSRDMTPSAPATVHHPWGRFSTESGGIAEAFRWIAFNQSYNGFFKPYTFDVPKGGRVRLVAVITGHGNDNHGCGEVCSIAPTRRRPT